MPTGTRSAGSRYGRGPGRPVAADRALVQRMRHGARRARARRRDGGGGAGAEAKDRLALERGVQRGGERRFAAHERVPAELVALTLAFWYELQPPGRDRQHIRLARDLDLALQRPVEPGCHGIRSPGTRWRIACPI